MFDGIAVRDARSDESGCIMEMTRLMVFEMQKFGGRQATADESAWSIHADRISTELKADNFKYFIAETSDNGHVGLGGARIGALEGIFAPKNIVHISVVYVLPDFRRKGVASKLMLRILDWGRQAGGDYFDLNAVVGNPARSFYEKFGFSDAAINMTRPIVAS